jgi:hypothetical protein
MERSRSLGSPFSLLKQLEAYDDGYGNITGRAFESTLGTETKISILLACLPIMIHRLDSTKSTLSFCYLHFQDLCVALSYFTYFVRLLINVFKFRCDD